MGFLQRGSARYCFVIGAIAEVARVNVGHAVGWNVVAAGELAEEVVGRGVVGSPTAVDDLGMVSRVVGLGEVGVVGARRGSRVAVAL